eukprot:gene2752-3005_t
MQMNESSNLNLKVEFELVEAKRVDISPAALYGVKFCPFSLSLAHCLATVGKNVLYIYRVNSPHEPLELLQSYVDSDKAEDFWACAWAMLDSRTPLVAAAGESGLIKVINTMKPETVTLFGHGGAVNELTTHPDHAHWLFSASNDRSVRLWNLRSMACVAIFAGDRGHKDMVLTMDVHLCGNCFVSGGADTRLLVWNLKDPALLEAARRAEKWDEVAQGRTFPPYMEQAPLFSTERVHSGYVDSVKWMGDCVLSKSTNQRMVLWTPDAYRYKTAPLILRDYLVHYDNVWFLRSDVFIPLGLVAVGTPRGKVAIYSTSRYPQDRTFVGSLNQLPKIVERYQFEELAMPFANLSVPEFNGMVRQVSFSQDGRYIAFCQQGGTLQKSSYQLLLYRFAEQQHVSHHKDLLLASPSRFKMDRSIYSRAHWGRSQPNGTGTWSQQIR